ncbi:MAG TPA: PepSY domain-containing protein [Phycisphaerae bacterium]|nr:PepSY domain-containing protein [Phycisphaerae bacterium]
MHWKKKSYLVHRWAGLLISVQLLAWSVGGLVFSLMDIEAVRGNRDRVTAAPSLIDPQVTIITPEQAVAAARRVLGDIDVSGLVLRSRESQLVFDVLGVESRPLAVVNASDSRVCTDIGAEEAKRIAIADFQFTAQVESVELIEDEAPLEYRGKRLPAYRVILDHAKAPHIFVCAVTGDVQARRNRSWRIFDFFWMLHIMDYGQRENFNHWLLTGASAMAVATSATGILLWGLRLKRRRRAAT